MAWVVTAWVAVAVQRDVATRISVAAALPVVAAIHAVWVVVALVAVEPAVVARVAAESMAGTVPLGCKVMVETLAVVAAQTVSAA
jgi:hypothetical protein